MIETSHWPTRRTKYRRRLPWLLILSLISCHAGITYAQVKKSDRNAALAVHNKARAEVGNPPLQLSRSLAKSAQAFAESLARANDGLYHSETADVGENLSMYNSSSKDLIDELRGEIAETSTMAWLEEKEEYRRLGSPHVKKGRHRGQRDQIGHFTAMIWRETTHVGFGAAISSRGDRIYLVAHYSPQGNIIGRHPWKDE